MNDRIAREFHRGPRPLRVPGPYPFAWHFATLEAELRYGETAEARLLISSNPPTSDPSSSDSLVTVYDWRLGSTESLDSGTRVWILFHPGYRRWYVMDWVC